MHVCVCVCVCVCDLPGWYLEMGTLFPDHGLTDLVKGMSFTLRALLSYLMCGLFLHIQ